MTNSCPQIISRKMTAREEIINYYEQCEIDYRLVWTLKKNLSMHYGYWDENTRTLKDALHNINRILAMKAVIKSTDKVLDAGCGVGGSSIYLASHMGCRVTGITLSARQVQTAKRNSEKYLVSALTNFQVLDYTDTGFPDATFDVVWGIESVCYASDKSDFFREAYRVLNGSGRLVIADFFKTQSDSHRVAIYRKFIDGWAVPDFAEINEFKKQAEAAGFTDVQTVDITANVTHSSHLLLFAFFPGVLCHFPLELLRLRNKVNRKNLWTALLQYVTLKKGLWKYYIVTAKKMKSP